MFDGRICYHIVARAHNWTLKHLSVWIPDACQYIQLTTPASLLLTQIYLLSHCGKREGLSTCTSQGGLQTDTTSVLSGQGSGGHCLHLSPRTAPSRTTNTSDWWVKFGTVRHTHTHANTVCPSDPTHLHSSLFHSALSLKYYLLSLSLSRVLSLSLSRGLCWRFLSHSHSRWDMRSAEANSRGFRSVYYTAQPDRRPMWGGREMEKEVHVSSTAITDVFKNIRFSVAANLPHLARRGRLHRTNPYAQQYFGHFHEYRWLCKYGGYV